jgi:thiamine-monophosphate kinase
MGLGEFGRIEKYFKPLAAGFPGALDLSDDAAVLSVNGLEGVVVSTDAIIETVHFLGGDPPDLIARKALRTNISDMAAMGAQPLAYTLALALSREDPEMSDAWVARLAAGLAVDQEIYNVHLIGGDSVSTPGPTMLSVTIFGAQPTGGVLRRSGALPGDDIYVSGTIGDAALGLKLLTGDIAPGDLAGGADLIDRYRLPRPRVALGTALVGFATAAMDVSDGLAQDLGNICTASGVTGEIAVADVPLSVPARSLIDGGGGSLEDVLAGGDDYELLFTASKAVRDAVAGLARATGTPITRIGAIEAGEGVTARDGAGRLVPLDRLGYRHA